MRVTARPANVFYQRRMAITQGAGGQSQVFKAHLRDDVHHHIDGQVTATESVMEETVMPSCKPERRIASSVGAQFAIARFSAR